MDAPILKLGFARKMQIHALFLLLMFAIEEEDLIFVLPQTFRLSTKYTKSLFLWIYWPSFNSGLTKTPAEYQRAVVNTYLSLASCTVKSFVLSAAVSHKPGKLDMVHIQNSPLAGGVGVEAVANLYIGPGAAIAVGIGAAFISVFGFRYLTCLKIIPERSAVTYINKTYFANISLNVRRIRKGGDYVANLEFYSITGLGHNVMIDLIFYEYLHNEFRRSFIEFHLKVCDLILKDPYLGSIPRKHGVNKCPVPPGQVSMRNVCLDVNVPSVWPFEKGKGVLSATDQTTGTLMASGEIVLTFKQK